MLLWIIIIVASILLDQITKIIVIETMNLGHSIVIWEDIFSFTRVHNYGAAWGMLSDHRWVFIVITAIAIIVMPIFLYRYRKLHPLFGFSLSLVIGGAIGNMIDRLFRGYVIDFLDATFIDFPVFNVADICVVCGAIMMFVYILFFDKELFSGKDKKKAPKEVQKNADGTNEENH